MSKLPGTLVGRRVKIAITDPWEFMSELGTEPLAGVIVGSESDMEGLHRLEIRLDKPIHFAGRRLQIFRAEPRYAEKPTIDQLNQGQRMPTSFQADEETADSGTGSESIHMRPVGLLGGLQIV